METTLSSLLAFCIFLTLGIWVASRQQPEDRGLLIKLFTLGFLLRVAVAIGIYLYLNIRGNEGGFYPFPDPPFYRDDWYYDMIGREIVESWKAGQSYFLAAHENPGYFYTGGIIYFLFGPNTLIVKMANCFFGALTILYVYLLAKKLWDERIAKLSATLAVFFPGFLAISAFQWKDSIVTFLVTFSVWSITVLKNKISLWRIILLISSMTYAFLIRKQTGIFLSFLAVFYILIDFRKLRAKHIILTFLIFIIVGTIFNKVRAFGFFGMEYFSNFNETLFSYSERASGLVTSTGLRNDILIKLMSGNLLTMILFLPIAIVIALVVPVAIPGFMQSGHEISALGMWVWYLWIPFFVYGFIYSFKKKPIEISHILITIVYVIASLLATGLLASGPDRYRLQMMPFAMILVAQGMIGFKRKRELYLLFLIVIGIFILIYIFKKMQLG